MLQQLLNGKNKGESCKNKETFVLNKDKKTEVYRNTVSHLDKRENVPGKNRRNLNNSDMSECSKVEMIQQETSSTPEVETNGFISIAVEDEIIHIKQKVNTKNQEERYTQKKEPLLALCVQDL